MEAGYTPTPSSIVPKQFDRYGVFVTNAGQRKASSRELQSSPTPDSTSLLP